MKSITVGLNMGNFDYKATSEIPEALEEIILAYGVTQLLQRVPSSAAEKLLAGYEKRPKGFERSSIPFTAENAKKFVVGMGTSVKVDTDAEGKAVMLNFTITDVVEHVTDTAESKFTEEQVIVGRHESAGDLEAWLKATVKYDGESHTPIETIDGKKVGGEYDKAMLAAVRDYKKARLAAM